MGWASAAAMVFGSVALAARPAYADVTAPVRFALVRAPGADGCADGATVADDVRTRLGRDPFDARALRSIEVALAREGRVWIARVYVRETGADAASVREIRADAPGCEALSAPVALAVALAIDPNAPLTAAPPAPPFAPPPAPPPIAPPAAPAVIPVAPAPRPHAWDRPDTFGPRLVLAAGLVPGLSAGAALEWLSPRVGPFRATGGAVFLPESRTSDGQFGFALAAMQLGACAGGAMGRLAARACASLWLGSVFAAVYTLEPVRPGGYLWLGAALSGAGSLHVVGPVSVDAGVDVVAPVTRYRFGVEGRSVPEFQQSPVALTVSLGASVRFP